MQVQYHLSSINNNMQMKSFISGQWYTKLDEKRDEPREIVMVI